MRCDCCENEATVFLTQIVGNKMQKVNLCGDCSAKQGVTDPMGFALADVLTGIGSEQQIRAPRREEATCPACGFSLSDFKKTGRLGCPECYDTFRENIRGILGNMHRGRLHTGKVPERLARRVSEAREAAAAVESNAPPADPGTLEPIPPTALAAAPPQPIEPSPPSPESPGDAPSLDELRSRLEKAIADEQYEVAARLRDRIRELESPEP